MFHLNLEVRVFDTNKLIEVKVNPNSCSGLHYLLSIITPMISSHFSRLSVGVKDLAVNKIMMAVCWTHISAKIKPVTLCRATLMESLCPICLSLSVH